MDVRFKQALRYPPSKSEQISSVRVLTKHFVYASSPQTFVTVSLQKYSRVLGPHAEAGIPSDRMTMRMSVALRNLMLSINA
jgi:hypothetical protein